MNSLEITNAELVEVRNQQVVTDSRSVAEHFGKRHDNVMMAIGGVLKNKETQQMGLHGRACRVSTNSE